MAEHANPQLNGGVADSPISFPKSVDEARTLAKERFKERLATGEKVGDCACHDDSSPQKAIANGRGVRTVGARFIDSGQVYFFDPGNTELSTGDWIVVETSRGEEAARVVIAPHQIATSQLKGELKPIVRRLGERDVEQMDAFRRSGATALKAFGAEVRARKMPMKPISAEYNFDGSQLTLSFSAGERVDFRDLARDLSTKFDCRIELRQVSARDEARLLGGLGRCGRTLCCSTWLPMFPEISMGMAKTQDLSLNPSKVSGVCGRLLCCLSYENEQYRQMKAVMPKLGQPTETPRGPGTVVSLQLLKGLVTVFVDGENAEATFHAQELGFGDQFAAPIKIERKPREVLPLEVAVIAEPVVVVVAEVAEDAGEVSAATSKSGRRRRRRRGRGPGSQSTDAAAGGGDSSPA